MLKTELKICEALMVSIMACFAVQLGMVVNSYENNCVHAGVTVYDVIAIVMFGIAVAYIHITRLKINTLEKEMDNDMKT